MSFQIRYHALWCYVTVLYNRLFDSIYVKFSYLSPSTPPKSSKMWRSLKLWLSSKVFFKLFCSYHKKLHVWNQRIRNHSKQAAVRINSQYFFYIDCIFLKYLLTVPACYKNELINDVFLLSKYTYLLFNLLVKVFLFIDIFS